MYPNCLITFLQQNKEPEVFPLKALPDLLKVFPEGLCRSPFFFSAEKPDQVFQAFSNGTLPLSGPFFITHSIRRARDIILEDVAYEGLSIQLEVAGKRLAELPPRPELEALLKMEKTSIVIDGRSYRPSSEVFGFQQVYDDTDKTISALKSLGIPQEIMNFQATPDEFSVEIHPGVFGWPEDPSLIHFYSALVHKVACVKRGEKQLIKTSDRTVILNAFQISAPILLSGSSHPILHRPKVEVGQTHFAYGIAAFSEHCAKKRNLDECQKELKSWLKFLDKAQPIIEPVKVALSGLVVSEPKISHQQKTSAILTVPTSGFRAFKQEVSEAVHYFVQAFPMLASPWQELNKALGGGWFPRGLHILASPREEGKASLLLSQALGFSLHNRVLYLSREHSFLEFAIRVASWALKTPINLAQSKSGAEIEGTIAQFKNSLEKVSTKLPENLFFRGIESSVNMLDVDEILELLKLVSDSKQGTILILESLDISELIANKDFLVKLKALGRNHGFTIFLSVHLKPGKLANPHLIDGSDLECLELWQPLADSICSLTSEKANSKRFLAITQGKVEAAVLEKLELNLYQGAGNKRLPLDTFSFLRILHHRYGVNRQAFLYLFQRKIMRFYEGFPFPLQRT